MTNAIRVLTLAACLLALGCQTTDPRPMPSADLMPIRHETVDARFFALIDLERPGLERTRELVQQERYAEALDAWRDYSVLKMRSRRSGKFGWHGYLNHPNRQAWARRLIGDESAAELVDIMNMTGPPSPDRQIDWMAKGDHGGLTYYSGWRGFTALVASYHRERDPIFLQKWFELTDKFAVEQKRAEQPYERAEHEGRLPQWDEKSHGQNLSAATRVHRIVFSLIYLSKALPDGQEPRDWNEEAQAPIATELEPGAIELIPADALANIVISLYSDHAELLKSVYSEAGRTPNQRYSGLTGLALVALYHDEFYAAEPLMADAGEAIEDYIATTVLPDGGDLEQSFNYNQVLVTESHAVIELFPEDDRPDWVSLLADAVARRERLFAGVARPFGMLPRIGTYGGQVPPRVWDAPAPDVWKTRLQGEVAEIAKDPQAAAIYAHLLGDEGGAAPDFTSIAYPYSGYYVMRDGWEMTSHYLWFLASRKGSGHRKENINGIAIDAFGRALLSNNGPQPYTPTFLPESQRPDYEQHLSYFGEKSSLTTNTVIVDLQSQRRHYTPRATAAYDTPIVARWHSSALYDFAEGRYADGYGIGKSGGPAPAMVTHQRQVVFLRPLGVWLVADRMTSDGETHDYQQMWHFPPPHEQWNVASPGFADDQVLTDDAARQIRTTDPDGPNIALHHFSPTPIRYLRYVGSKDPWLGWYAIGIGGLRLPSVDVHATWHTADDSIVTTLLAPSAALEPLVATSEDLSRPGLAGGRATLTDGAEVAWLWPQSQGELELAGIRAQAEGLVAVTRPGQPTTGIAIGVTSLQVAGQVIAEPPRDFEWRLDDAGFQIVAPIEYPDTPDVIALGTQGGLHLEPVAVHVTAPARPGAVVRYSLDGAPSADSPVADGPIRVSQSATLTAQPFRDGKPSGDPVSADFDIRPLPPRPPTPDLSLRELEPTDAQVGAFTLTRDAACYGGGPLMIAGRKYASGYSAHAPAHLDFAVPAGAMRVVATIGLDDVTATRGDVVARILADGKEIARTPLLAGAAQRYWHLDVAVPAGAASLRIQLDPGAGGWNMVDIVDAGFIMVKTPNAE